ncbi:unnamed protein product [Musa textilis]
MNYGSMMESLMNAIILQASLEKLGVEVRIQSTLMMQEIAEPYIRHELSIILKNEESKYLVGLVQPQETHFLAQILQLPCGPLKVCSHIILSHLRMWVTIHPQSAILGDLLLG